MAAWPQGMVREREKRNRQANLSNSMSPLTVSVYMFEWTTVKGLNLDLIIRKGINQMQNILLYSMQHVM